MEELFTEPRLAGVVDELFMEMLSRGSSLRLNVISGSMRPLIRIGDNVVVRQIKPNDLIVSDIIVYRTNQKYITHRIFSKRKDNGQFMFYTKGDMSMNFDPLITEEQIIGKVMAIEKSNRILRLDNLSGMAINYFIFFYFFISLSIYRIARFLKRELIDNKKSELINFCHRFFWKTLPLLPQVILKIMGFLNYD